MPQVAPYSGAMLAMVARSASGSAARPGPKNSTNLPTTPFLRSICVTVSTRSVAVAPSGSWPCSLKPTTCGISIDTGWPSMAASASMPPTPQPSTPRPLIIVVCESVPTSVSGYAAPFSLHEHDAGQVFEIDLVDDARLRRHDLEVAKRVLAPAEERRSAPVLRSYSRSALRRRRGRAAEVIDLHRVIDDQLDRLQRIDLGRIAAERLHGVAHRRQIDDARDAGEILQQHAARRERDFLGRLGVRIPLGERLDIGRADGQAVLGAQQVFEQNLERERQPSGLREISC